MVMMKEYRIEENPLLNNTEYMNNRAGKRKKKKDRIASDRTLLSMANRMLK